MSRRQRRCVRGLVSPYAEDCGCPSCAVPVCSTCGDEGHRARECQEIQRRAAAAAKERGV